VLGGLRAVSAIGLLVLLVVIAIDYGMRLTSSPQIYSDISKIPSVGTTKRAALVLGTAKYLKGGGVNYFYTYRIRAAVELYESGKVDAIVVSGDNGSRYYDETTTMQQDLIAAGVPRRYITLDYAGFRTLDSVVRADAIFGLDDYIIVSQRFHLIRAVYIAQAKGQHVIGYTAKELPHTAASYRMKLREYLARTKAMLDLYILHTEPKFYGKRLKVTYR